MHFNLRNNPELLAKINSLTKYPSIPTYHNLDNQNGLLLPNRFFDQGAIPNGTSFHLSEKVDGTNGRVILLPHGPVLVGSREEILHCMGDVVWNPVEGIVEMVLPFLDQQIARKLHDPKAIITLYFEGYGGRTGSHKNYTRSGRTGVRIFDMMIQPDYEELLQRPITWFSGWREAGNQGYVNVALLQEAASLVGLPTVPPLATLNADQLPVTRRDMHNLLQALLPKTLVALDEEALGRPEGFVLRTGDRKLIAKARYEDYERTFRKQPDAE